MTDLLTEFEEIFGSTYIDDVLIDRSAGIKDMIVVFMQPEAYRVGTCSRLSKVYETLSSSMCESALLSQE